MTYPLDDKTFMEHEFVRLFKSYIEKDAPVNNFCDWDNTPMIKQHNQIYNVINNNNKTIIEVDATKIAPEEMRIGLAILYGFGYIRYEYDLPIFDNCNNSEKEFIMDLATEIWDRRVHMYWMQKVRKRRGHNRSKNLEFCINMARKKKEKAIEQHHKDCAELRDTEHHMHYADFRRNLERQDPVIKEMLDDQASIAGRYYKEKERIKEGLSCSEYQDKIMNRGVYLEEIIAGTKKEIYWNPTNFGMHKIDVRRQAKVWKYWKKSNHQFDKFREALFGPDNIRYIPPRKK